MYELKRAIWFCGFRVTVVVLFDTLFQIFAVSNINEILTLVIQHVNVVEIHNNFEKVHVTQPRLPAKSGAAWCLTAGLGFLARGESVLRRRT